MDASPEAIATLSSLASQESSGDPNAVNAESGASGLMQMMPETFAAFSQGGDIMDPIANIVASIAYQNATYGGLVDFSPYAKGGFAMAPHMGLIGEAGREMVVPLDHRGMAAQARQTLGTAGMDDGLDALSAELRNLREDVKGVSQAVGYQTTVMGDEIAGGVGRRMVRDPKMQGSMVTAQDRIDRSLNRRGVRG
jgi:SLT domain-containing protein